MNFFNAYPAALVATCIQAIEVLNALKATHRAALAELDALFASLQQRAFSGALKGKFALNHF